MWYQLVLVFFLIFSVTSHALLRRPTAITKARQLVRIHAVSEITSASSFDESIKAAGDKLVIVDYSTTWCGPCKLVYPKYVELSEKYPEVVFLKCVGDSTSDTNALMKREGIRSVPTFHFWKNGNKCDVINGARIDDVEAALKSLK